MKEGRKFNKIVSLVLAAVMMVSVFAVATPQEVEAASTFSQSFKSSGTTNLKIKKTQSYGYTKKDTLIKFKPKNDGYIDIKLTSGDSDSFGYITFCDSKKKNIGVNKEYFDTASKYSFAYNRTYAVKKNTTYYFKVRSSDYLKIKATVKNLKKDAGTKKSNAKTLDRNRAKKGIILQGDKKVDWYKINMSGSHKLSLTCKVKTNGVTGTIAGNNIYYGAKPGVKVTFCGSNGKQWAPGCNFKVTAINSPRGQTYVQTDQFNREYPIDGGTYYVKVERINSKSSAYYELKWSYK